MLQVLSTFIQEDSSAIESVLGIHPDDNLNDFEDAQRIRLARETLITWILPYSHGPSSQAYINSVFNFDQQKFRFQACSPSRMQNLERSQVFRFNGEEPSNCSLLNIDISISEVRCATQQVLLDVSVREIMENGNSSLGQQAASVKIGALIRATSMTESFSLAGPQTTAGHTNGGASNGTNSGGGNNSGNGTNTGGTGGTDAGAGNNSGNSTGGTDAGGTTGSTNGPEVSPPPENTYCSKYFSYRYNPQTQQFVYEPKNPFWREYGPEYSPRRVDLARYWSHHQVKNGGYQFTTGVKTCWQPTCNLCVYAYRPGSTHSGHCQGRTYVVRILDYLSPSCRLTWEQVGIQYGSGCVAEETKILLADKTYKQIRSLERGDHIWNPITRKSAEIFGIFAPSHSKIPEIYEININGKVGILTGNHVVRTDEGPVPISTMAVSNRDYRQEGYVIKVKRRNEFKQSFLNVLISPESENPDEHWFETEFGIVGDLWWQMNSATEK